MFIIKHFHGGKLNYVICIGEVENSNFLQRGVILQARFLPGNSPGWIQSGQLDRVYMTVCLLYSWVKNLN